MRVSIPPGCWQFSLPKAGGVWLQVGIPPVPHATAIHAPHANCDEQVKPPFGRVTLADCDSKILRLERKSEVVAQLKELMDS